MAIVREGKNVKGRLLGAFLGTAGKGHLVNVFDNTVRAIEARNDRVPAADIR